MILLKHLFSFYEAVVYSDGEISTFCMRLELKSITQMDDGSEKEV